MMKLNITVLALAVSFAASADTVAWWHFDECDSGTTAPANTVASDQAPTTYAHVYTIGDSGAMSALHENDGDYLPVYAKPFRGLAVYDPVTDTTRTNRAAMKFRIDRGGPNPDTNAGRARFGGGLKFDDGYNLYQPLYGTSALTIEAFVCTTGGVYHLFAPIVGSIGGTSWTSERFSLLMRDDGTIAVRFTTSSGTAIWYDGDGRGKTKVNDGAWHHVAFTYDGSNARIYVDYALDKKNSDSSDRVYDKTGTIPTYSGDNATWIGGYAYGDASNGGRKFPGVIDEVRVSNAVLTPDQFLRMQPLDMDPDEIARVSFTPDEYGVMLEKDYIDIGDALRPNNADLAVFRKVSGAGSSACDTAIKAGDVIAAGMYSERGLADVASFYQETNDVCKANYIQMPFISKLISGNDGAAASYTVEMFYKTRKTVRGTDQQRQVLMKFGGSAFFNVLFDAKSANLLYAFKMNGADQYVSSAATNVDDQRWHHVAVVVDGAAETNNICFYIDYRLDRFATGTMPDLGNNSLFFASKESGAGQWYDGWLDDIRVTRRALTPEEFMTTHPVGTGDASLLALFENDYAFTCASNAAFSVTGTGEARSGGNAPTFVKESRGTLLLDGTNGTERATNEYSVRLNTSRVVFPPSALFELDTYTVEFWAKFDGIVDGNGVVAADSTSLPQHAPIMRLARGDSSDFNWYLYRAKGESNLLQMAMNGSYTGWNLPTDLTVDGKWHHYALTFEPNLDNAQQTYVQLFYDYKPLAKKAANRSSKCVAGHRLILGEGTYEQPNIVGEFDAVRVSRGVLDPSRFLGRVGKGTLVIIQ